MNRDRASALILDTLCDYINGYAESAEDISRITGEGYGHKPDQENVAMLATALRAVGRDRIAQRLEALASR